MILARKINALIGVTAVKNNILICLILPSSIFVEIHLILKYIIKVPTIIITMTREILY